MAAKIFGRGMQNEIGAEIERPLQHRRPGIVANQKCAGVVNDPGHGRKIDNLQKWIGGRFRPGQLCLWAQRFLDRGQIAHVDKIDFESPAQKNFAEQSRGAVVSVDVSENVIARGQCLNDPHGGCGSRSESRGRCASFQRSHSLFERPAIGVVVARVHESARVGPFDVALECGGQMDRRGHRACSGINRVTGVHRESLNFHLGATLRIPK